MIEVLLDEVVKLVIYELLPVLKCRTHAFAIFLARKDLGCLIKLTYLGDGQSQRVYLVQLLVWLSHIDKLDLRFRNVLVFLL